MTQKTLRRLFPLMITMFLGIFMTTSYIKMAPKENIRSTESKNNSHDRKPHAELMIWKSLSRHLLSLR